MGICISNCDKARYFSLEIVKNSPLFTESRRNAAPFGNRGWLSKIYVDLETFNPLTRGQLLAPLSL